MKGMHTFINKRESKRKTNEKQKIIYKTDTSEEMEYRSCNIPLKLKVECLTTISFDWKLLKTIDERGFVRTSVNHTWPQPCQPCCTSSREYLKMFCCHTYQPQLIEHMRETMLRITHRNARWSSEIRI